ncbi:MAG TPA: helix-turn-helix domain-containing protein [Candidatus Peribacteraceae bacterium]|nr:helix-turn-helix domain-containing protein [Candidatus Peribacteraceae bacterium]
MSITLPLAVEQYLEESGFSGSEIIVLRKLLEEDMLTIRELAAKTGKSNGVIDVALKKLIRRNIVGKENLNGHPKYKVVDPRTIVTWTKNNLREHMETLERKHQSFAQFMSNLTVTKAHPEIEHFSGKEGFMKAYDQLLEYRTELLTYVDPASIPDDDPLSAFHSQYNRRRQVHDVFQRIVAPDSPAARRFRSRDPFEFRKTVLVKPEEYPMSFTKIIAGDTIACMDVSTLEASLIHFEKLASSERAAFDRLWEAGVRYEQSPSAHAESIATLPQESVRMRIRTMNGLQKICLGFLGFLALFWTGLFSTHTVAGPFNYLYSLLFGLIPLVSGAIALFSVKRWGGLTHAIGRAVLFMGLGIFLWGFGAMIWSYYNFVLNVAAPYPSFADVGFAPSIFLYGLGVIFLADATGAKAGLKNIYAKIFVVIAPLVILAFSYYALVIVARGGVLVTAGDPPLKTFFDIVYPLGDLLGLTIAVLVSGLSFKYMGGRYTTDILAILLGLAVMFIGDFVFSYTTTIGTYYDADPGDLILTLGVFLLSFGVLGFAQDKRSPLILVA